MDALRGLAALGVALYHFTDVYFMHAHPLAFIFIWTRYGVNLFFMISGFVMLMTLEKVRGPLDFSMSRFARLFPAYWAAIGMTFLATRLAGAEKLQVDAHAALINLTMLQGFLNIPSVDFSYWTLKTELSFYFLLFLLLCFRSLGRINPVLIGLMALAMLDKIYGPSGPNPSPLLSDFREGLILPYIQYFAVGIVIFQLAVKGDRAGLYHYLILVLALALTKQNLPWAGTGLHVLFAGTLYLVASGYAGPLASKPLVWLGLISYPFYLIHQYLGFVILDWVLANGWGPTSAILMALTACLALAAMIYMGVEKPARQAILSRYREYTARSA